MPDLQALDLKKKNPRRASPINKRAERDQTNPNRKA
jgi:hypothetical protein